ncbi:Rpp14/Pop5 family protein [Methanosphaera cuniculi]|uniref:Rpp14/Pop5 family protein n=1 Tax=Methanosphaera cuniculi TaxID=1077256 RepID=UPI0026F05C9A|nr:Rpp14/Pop5 family protein [Methanosphaera cuniculi]
MVMINKLKILPPTLREKKRYIAFNLYSQNKVAKDTLIPYLWNTIINLYGEIHASKINIWISDFNFIEFKDNINKYTVIVKCQRGYEDDFITMLNTLTYFKGKRIVADIIGISGTIRAIRKKI